MSGLEKMRKLANRYKNYWRIFGAAFIAFSLFGIIAGALNAATLAGVFSAIAGLCFQSAFFLIIYARVSEMFLYQTEAMVEAIEDLKKSGK
jgi:formate/nitrite transporter FocA (FNT family)